MRHSLFKPNKLEESTQGKIRKGEGKMHVGSARSRRSHVRLRNRSSASSIHPLLLLPVDRVVAALNSPCTSTCRAAHHRTKKRAFAVGPSGLGLEFFHARVQPVLAARQQSLVPQPSSNLVLTHGLLVCFLCRSACRRHFGQSFHTSLVVRRSMNNPMRSLTRIASPPVSGFVGAID